MKKITLFLALCLWANLAFAINHIWIDKNKYSLDLVDNVLAFTILEGVTFTQHINK